MKKLISLIALTISAYAMVSCREETTVCTFPPPPPPTVLMDAIYYGEQLAEDVGCFSLTFTKGNNKLRLDIFSVVALNPYHPRILSGNYHLGTMEEASVHTYFVAESESSDFGTLYWDNGIPVLVTGGTVNVSADSSGYHFIIALHAGEAEVNWKYSGYLSF